jgi:hypothetical protein
MSCFIVFINEFFNYISIPSFSSLLAKINFFVFNNFSLNKLNFNEFNLLNVKEIFKLIFKRLFNNKLFLGEDSINNIEKHEITNLNDPENLIFEKKDKGKGKATYSDSNTSSESSKSKNSLRKSKKNYSLAVDYRNQAESSQFKDNSSKNSNKSSKNQTNLVDYGIQESQSSNELLNQGVYNNNVNRSVSEISNESSDIPIAFRLTPNTLNNNPNLTTPSPRESVYTNPQYYTDDNGQV